MVLLMWLIVINDILDKWRTKQGVFPNILALLVVCLFINFYIVSLPMTWSSRFPTMYRGYIQLLNLPTLYKLARTIEHLLCLTSGLLYMLILSSQGRFLLNFRKPPWLCFWIMFWWMNIDINSTKIGKKRQENMG